MPQPSAGLRAALHSYQYNYRAVLLWMHESHFACTIVVNQSSQLDQFRSTANPRWIVYAGRRSFRYNALIIDDLWTRAQCSHKAGGRRVNFFENFIQRCRPTRFNQVNKEINAHVTIGVLASSSPLFLWSCDHHHIHQHSYGGLNVTNLCRSATMSAVYLTGMTIVLAST